MATVDKLALPETQVDILLDFIRLILPIQNNCPLSYYSIKKSIGTPDITSTLICKICDGEIETVKPHTKKCNTEGCASASLGLKSNSFIKVFNANIITQITRIYSEHHNTILKYKGS